MLLFCIRRSGEWSLGQEMKGVGTWVWMSCVRGCFFFFSSRRRHTRFDCDWSSDVCSSDLGGLAVHDANCGEVPVGREPARPLLRIGGHVRLEPSEPDLVAVEEAPQLGAG